MQNNTKQFDITELTKASNNIKYEKYIQSLDNGIIYHYTSIDGFKSIIENHTLRFTDRNYLNDYTEGKYVLNLCYQHRDELFKEHPGIKKAFEKSYKNKELDRLYPFNRFDVFQCSFSLNPDSLCMWNYYTKGDSMKGYNIGFDSAKCYGLKNKGADETSGSLNFNKTTFIGKVIYSEEQQVHVIQKIIDQFSEFFSSEYRDHYAMIINVIMDKIKSIGTFFKPDCFALEDEVRIAFNFDPTNFTIKAARDIDKDVELDFIERHEMIVPYFDVPFAPDIVQEIHLSPTIDADVIKNDVYGFLVSNSVNVDKSKIIESHIPVRF